MPSRRETLEWLALASAGALLPSIPAVRSRALDPYVVDGVRFASSVDVAGLALRLHRAVLFRYRRMFRAYRAGLYLGTGVAPAQVLADVPKRLELCYCVSIEGEDFGPAAEAILSRTYDASALAPLKTRLDRLSAAYTDVREGDRYALTNVPGRGLELAKNGSPVITIPGADFQRAYFSIWFGRDPLSSHLRDQLLAPVAPA